MSPSLPPSSVAVEALQKFLTCTESSLMLERLEQQDCWSLLEKEESCAHGMLILARALAEEHWDLVQPTVETLGANLMSVYDSHRITVVAFYSEVHKSSSYQVCTNIVLLVLLGTCCALHTHTVCTCVHVHV